MVALDGEQQVELRASFAGHLLVLMRAVRLAAELRVPHPQRPASHQGMSFRFARLFEASSLVTHWSSSLRNNIAGIFFIEKSNGM